MAAGVASAAVMVVAGAAEFPLSTLRQLAVTASTS